MSELISYEDAREAKRLERQAEIVGGLEELLRRAQAGEFRGICYCGIGRKVRVCGWVPSAKMGLERMSW